VPRAPRSGETTQYAGRAPPDHQKISAVTSKNTTTVHQGTLRCIGDFPESGMFRMCPVSVPTF
jgi:hypothetical protein